MFVYIFADQPVEPLQLRFGEQVGRRDFVTARQRIVVTFRAVDAVRSARVTCPRDHVAKERVDDRSFGFDGDFAFPCRTDGAFRCIPGRRHVAGNLTDRGRSRLFGRPFEILQVEKTVDVHSFDRCEGGGVLGVGDRSEAIFEIAGEAVPADQRVGAYDGELRPDRAFRAGPGRQSGGGQEGEGGEFHGDTFLCLSVKIAQKAFATPKNEKNHRFCRKILEFRKKALSVHHKTKPVDSSKG